MALIEPRTLKGFRDYLPEAMIPRERLIETARTVYRSYGFAPIDTPALEYEEILTGKGGEESDKQLYAFEDNGGRRVALRFDLTVPLARFVAQHSNELGMPFKRYHIASVWRGENTQRGRYREFMQCDFDTIGSDSLTVDIEAVLVVGDLLRSIGFTGADDFTIYINNRKVLTGLLHKRGLGEHTTGVLRALDKLGKFTPEQVTQEMVSGGYASATQAEQFLQLLLRIGKGEKSNEEKLVGLDRELQGNEVGELGVHEIREILRATQADGMNAPRIHFDPWIARGLDYYTGTVFETLLGKLMPIGSVCSGGRYDNLAQLYTKERLPGVGASLGLDRLLAAMEELGLIEKRGASAAVFVPYFAQSHRDDYLRLATRLRRAHIGVEFYPEPKKLGQQLKYADRRGFKLALIIGDDEWRENRCQLKDLETGESRTLPIDDASGALDPTLLAALARIL